MCPMSTKRFFALKFFLLVNEANIYIHFWACLIPRGDKTASHFMYFNRPVQENRIYQKTGLLYPTHLTVSILYTGLQKYVLL